MAKVEIDSEELKKLKLDASRYEFLRDEDNWGEDSGENCWGNLGESHGLQFDAVVDSRIKEAVDAGYHDYDDTM